MRPLPRSAWLYIGLVTAWAAALLVAFFPIKAVQQPEPLMLAILSVLGLVYVGTHGIPIREKVRVALTTVIIFAATVLLDVSLAAWVTAIGLAWAFIRLRRRWYNTVFNCSAYVLTVFCTGFVYTTLDDRPAILFGSAANMLALLTAGAVYYLANTLLVSLVVDLREGKVPISSWMPTMRSAGPEYFTLILLGILAALLYGVNRPLILLVVVPAIIVYDSYRTSQELRLERDRLIDTEESVRRQLQMDLHDGLAQTLAAMTMRASIATRQVTGEPEKAKAELVQLEKELRDATRGVRTLLYELRPLVLESQGLVPAVETYIARLQVPGAPQMRLEVAGLVERLDHRAEISLFGIVQEGVNNIIKHAQATTVLIRIVGLADHIEMTIRDDGKGFDPAQVQERYSQRGSFGLLNMQERATRIGGELQLTSEIGKGTLVSVSVPRHT